MTMPICIFGPTAAGKTALSIALAKAVDGVVINADAMQVYSDLSIVTARPSPQEVAQVPHRLFGVLDATDPCNAVRWTEMARQEIAAAQQAGKYAILVGGTGLYFRALLSGLDDIPAVDPTIRAEVRALSLEQLRDALGVEEGDHQRLARQLEVLRQTGRPLEHFHTRAATAEVPHVMITLTPPREALYARIDARFEAMLAGGQAQAEVQTLLERGLPRTLPCMRAIGVPELAAVFSGEMTLGEATAAAQQASRRYAKRQMTWARNQVKSNVVLEELLVDSGAVSAALQQVLEHI